MNVYACVTEINTDPDTIFNYDVISICPNCRVINNSDNGDGIVFQDYISCPMVWCWMCDTKSVLLEKEYKQITKEYFFQQNPDMDENKLKEELYADKLIFLEIPLAKILKISNGQLYYYKINNYDNFIEQELNKYVIKDIANIIMSYDKITSDIVREFVKSAKKDKYSIERHPCEIENETDERKNIRNMYRIVNKKEDEFDNVKDNNDIHNDFWKLSLPVNSYNSENPLIKYPSNFDLSHDGIYIYLLYEDLKGNIFCMNYWGD